MRKFLTALVALVAAAGISRAANVPLLSGAQYSEPSQILATINTLIQTINSNVGGLANSQPTAVAGSATSAEQTFFTYTLPAAAIASAGQGIRVYCWGGTGATATNKTMKLYFGNQVVATPAAATNNKGWLLEQVVYTRSATRQAFMGKGTVDTTAVAIVASDATETLASGVVIKCTGIQASAVAHEIVASGFLVELIK